MHDDPTMLSQTGPVTFSCVNVISMSCMFTPRSVSKCRRLMLAPTNTRPRPSVGARSPKTAPGDPEVGTGTPASNRNVEPPLVALTGTFPAFWLIAELMKAMSEPLSALAEGTK